jgi:hypothetical protein
MYQKYARHVEKQISKVTTAIGPSGFQDSDGMSRFRQPGRQDTAGRSGPDHDVVGNIIVGSGDGGRRSGKAR